MQTRSWAIASFSIVMILFSFSPSADAFIHQYGESFTTTQYRDAIGTTAWWDTVAGEIKLFPFEITLVGSYLTPGQALGVTVVGDYAYVAGTGLHVIDISDPTNPTLAGSYTTPEATFDSAIAGDYAYVAGRYAGLLVFDISDPTNPALVATHNTPGSAVGVVVSGDYAYVGDYWSGLQVVDISDPATPTLAGSCATLDIARGVGIGGNYVYVAVNYSGVQVIDVSDPTNPTPVGSCDTPNVAYGLSISVDYVYVGDNHSGLQVIDISDPTDPTIVGNCSTPGIAYGIAIDGDRAYVADHESGLQVIDISDPTTPILVSSYDTPGQARVVDVAWDLAYVADRASGLQVLRIARFDTESNVAQSVTVDGSSEIIYRAQVTTSQVDSVRWELSADGGGAWDEVLPGTPWHTFASPGTDLVWRSTHVDLGSGNNPACGLLQIEWLNSFGPENIVCDPDTAYLTAVTPIQSVDVDYLGGGSGLVYAYSIRFSWDPAVVGCSPANVSEGDLLSDQGNTWFEVHESGGNEITVDCVLLGAQPGVSGPGTMFTAEFTGLAVGVSDLDVTVLKVRDKDNMDLTGFLERDGLLVTDVQTPSVSNVLIENLTLAHTNDFIKDGDAARVTATVTDDDPLFTRTDITADLFVFGEGSSLNPDSYTGNVATWTLPLPSVVCNPQDGLLEVTVTATDPIGNSASDVGDITADNTDPGPITGFDASPHHERVSLSWDNPGGLDTHFYGVLVRYDAGGDYPEYIALGSYPVDQNDGDGEAFNQTGAVTGGDHPVIPRDIHYYTAFAYDMALNYGAAAGSARDRATNYWLGDVAAYDGYVDFGDISDLSGTYWLDEGESGWNAECDVGPTDNASALGIPLPDDEVGFEDLIIFAMNFSVVSPTGKIPQVQIAGGEDTGALRLRLVPESTDEDPGSFRVVLDGNRDQVKAARIEIRHDPGCAAFLGVSPSPALMSAGRVFLQGAERSPGHVIIDLAVLGNGEVLHGSGDLATLRFRIDDPVAAVKLDHVDLRGAGNTKLLAAMENAAGAGGEVMPNVTRLTGAEPNPFNPATTVRYTLDRPEQVRVRIFDAEGRLVRGLVDGPRNAGHHRAVWDGRNDRGRALGSGIYFVQMTAGDYSSTSKVVLLR